jgi:hypothetical protein
MWCPFARAFIASDVAGTPDGAAGVNRIVDKHTLSDTGAADLIGAGCVGSMCMAWRWRSPKDEDAEDGKGYCGLAGKP